ncbi:DeoR family transcriptional regulator [Candidatus Parcubacteria bacterium]|nr:DeoR family transcriptional regulator [Candidatus Parcubacteria bacterium]
MLSNRQNSLLNFVIREYIRTAKPVGSSLVCKKTKLKVSPATIRNDMNELEEQGLLIQLHTSGGRVPTDRAYRHYVNSIIQKLDLEPEPKDKKKIKQVLADMPPDPQEINKALAQLLSNLSENLVITGISQDKDFFKKGFVSLLENPEFREISKITQLASFFEEFEQMFKFIEHEFFHILGNPQGPPIQIMIGQESPFNTIQHETIMCAKYSLPGNCVGSLTLVGPTRMDYEKNIGLIKYVTEELNKLTKQT